jgi:hypothetical protein
MDIPIVFIYGFVPARRSWLWRPPPVPGSRLSYRTPPIFYGDEPVELSICPT